MILEARFLAGYDVQHRDFEAAFSQASKIIASMSGYHSHQLQRCLEVDNTYLLLVEWNTLEDHTVGFRGSLEYVTWKKLLHHFYDPFPTVEHFTTVFTNDRQ